MPWRTAGQEVENALVGFLRSQEQARSLTRSVRAAGAAAKIGVNQYRTGVIPFNIARSDVMRVSATGAMAFTVTPMRWNSIEAVRVRE